MWCPRWADEEKYQRDSCSEPRALEGRGNCDVAGCAPVVMKSRRAWGRRTSPVTSGLIRDRMAETDRRTGLQTPWTD